MDNVVSQQIPHDSEAEKAVLGAVFLDPEAIIDASDVLQPDDFYEHANRIVFQAMLNISDREEVIDPVTLQDELKKNNQVDDIGGSPTLQNYQWQLQQQPMLLTTQKL